VSLGWASSFTPLEVALRLAGFELSRRWVGHCPYGARSRVLVCRSWLERVLCVWTWLE